jgi:hypothetical protein
MGLVLRRVDGAEVRPFTPTEKLLLVNRRDRATHDGYWVKLPRARRLTVLPTEWLLPGSTVRASETMPYRLELTEDAGRSYWLIGDGVYWLHDLDVTAEDVRALYAVRTKRRANQLDRTHAFARSIEAQIESRSQPC